MTVTQPNIQNQQLAALASKAGNKVTSAIQKASAETGVDFSYLMQQAQAESSFQTDVKAKTSSATGLFQFIDRTWIDMVQNHGEKYGIDTSAPKSELLALRKDPEISSLMAGELASENSDVLKARLGQDFKVGPTELYFAHFMGAGKAAGFLDTLQQKPQAAAANLFPAEAKANHGVFYNAKGQARSVGEIYAFFDKKFAIKGGSLPQNDIQIAQRQPDTDETRLKDYVSNFMGLQKQENEKTEFLSEDASTIERLAAHHPYMDILNSGGGKTHSTLPLMGSNSRFPSVAFGNLIQNPTDVLWLAQLNDDLISDNRI